MSINNLELWDKVFKTNPEHTKSFTRAGGFKGTAIKPLYLIHKATEIWGAMGDKWGAESAEHIIEGDTVFIRAVLWYITKDGRRAEVTHWGGDVLVKTKNDGSITPNDEAFKMAFTDAIGKCLSQLGFSADVRFGLFDDSKYVSDATKEFNKDILFKTASARKEYVTNAINALKGCETLEELKETYKLYYPKLVQMQQSSNEHDNLGYDEVEKTKDLRKIKIQDDNNYKQAQQDFAERK